MERVLREGDSAVTAIVVAVEARVVYVGSWSWRKEMEGTSGCMSKPLKNSFVSVQVLKGNGFNSWGTGTRRFCS